MGINDPVSLDEKMADTIERAGGPGGADDGKRYRFYVIVLLVAAAVYAGA